jgi:diguanylate cyclase (GGDEF)-like protein/PAS domain S-box-containing protein
MRHPPAQAGEVGGDRADVDVREASMTNRAELLEAALDSFPEGAVLVDAEGLIAFWNRTAVAILGYPAMELIARPLPEALEALVAWPLPGEADPCAESATGCGSMVRLRHKLGHFVPVMTRTLVLRDEMGGRMGRAAIFHPAESLDALPHGDCSEGAGGEESMAEFEDRLGAVFDDFRQGGETFGVLWITVDQAHDLRKTHGAGACNRMLDKVERAMGNGLRPAEEMARWGDDEFLVLSFERTPEMLAVHAQTLAGLARTADFHWWGDRISLTVSIGAAQAKRDGSLTDLLDRAKAAMFSSFQAGGNHITSAQGGQECLPL